MCEGINMTTLVINKGRSTHVIPNIVHNEIRSVVVGFFYEDDKEHLDQLLWFFVKDRARGFGVHLGEWDNVYFLHNETIPGANSNLEWVKGG